jgi:hypothetical protein
MAKPEKNRPSVWRHQLGRAMSGTHEDDSHPRRPRWRIRALLITGAIAVGLFYIASRTKSDDMNVELNLKRWGMGRVVLIESESGNAEITRKTSYRVGPLGFLRSERVALVVLGTNAVHVGDRLYDPTTKREIWTVLAVEKRHEFDDGTDRDRVLVRHSGQYGEAWLPRKKIGKVLVGR